MTKSLFYRELFSRLSSYGTLAAALCLLPALLWSLGAVYYCFKPGTAVFAVFLAAQVSLFAAGLFRFRALAALLVIQIAVALAFMMIRPEDCFSGTQWQTPWKRGAAVEFDASGQVMLRNIRDFRYRSENDYDIRYLDRRFAAADLESADIALSHWDGMEAVAHSMIGFNFRNGESVVFSLETRLPEGCAQETLPGLYKNYAIVMLAGTPADLYGLRADHRGESLYVYRLNAAPEQLKRLFAIVTAKAHEINLENEFYNTLTRNCTTGIMPFLLRLGEEDFRDLRLVCNGFSDSMLFERNMLLCRPGENFASLKARSLVPGKASGRSSVALRYLGESANRWLHQR